MLARCLISAGFIAAFALPAAAQVQPNPQPFAFAGYPHLSAAGSQILVDPMNSGTDLFPYSAYTGRGHGNLFYTAPQMRTLQDDRGFMRALEEDFTNQYGTRRAGMRQLDAQNRRSGYRLIAGVAPQATTAQIATQAFAQPQLQQRFQQFQAPTQAFQRQQFQQQQFPQQAFSAQPGALPANFFQGASFQGFPFQN